MSNITELRELTILELMKRSNSAPPRANSRAHWTIVVRPDQHQDDSTPHPDSVAARLAKFKAGCNN